MKIKIETIPHHKHRYDGTAGDWFFDKKGNLTVRVSKLGNWKWEFLLITHELIEAVLCRHAGICQHSVTKFDKDFEKSRTEANFEEEPGDDDKAPYRMQHLIATSVEKLLAALLGVSWKKYDDALTDLFR